MYKYIYIYIIYIHIYIYIYIAPSTLLDNISTRREVVEFRWDTRNTQPIPY